MIAELVAAGVESGHPLGQWEAVRTLWGPYRLSVLQVIWRKYGPPSYISLGFMAGTREQAKPKADLKSVEVAAKELIADQAPTPNRQALPAHVLADILAKAKLTK